MPLYRQGSGRNSVDTWLQRQGKVFTRNRVDENAPRNGSRYIAHTVGSALRHRKFLDLRTDDIGSIQSAGRNLDALYPCHHAGDKITHTPYPGVPVLFLRARLYVFT